MTIENRYQRLRHRKLLIKYKNDQVATETAIVSFYERKLDNPELTADERTHYELRLDEALERLGVAIGD